MHIKPKHMNLSKQNNKKTGKKFTPQQVLIDPKRPCIRIYTDGSCLVNPGGAGTCSFVMVENDKVVHQHGEHYTSTTNNRMEIRAVMNAIEYIKSVMWEEQVVIYMDSTYVYSSILKKVGKQVNKNGDLWEQMKELVAQNPNIKYMWTQGHAGHKWNEYADEMCRETYKKAAILDIGYMQVSRQKATNVSNAKQYLLSKYLPTTSPEEQELWYKCSDWARQVVTIMEDYKNSK